jgi:hypothetical protein
LGGGEGAGEKVNRNMRCGGDKMKLREARLCLDCEEVFAGSETCPACGSRAWFPIKKWLDRELTSEDWLKQHVCLRKKVERKLEEIEERIKNKVQREAICGGSLL